GVQPGAGQRGAVARPQVDDLGPGGAAADHQVLAADTRRAEIYTRVAATHDHALAETQLQSLTVDHQECARSARSSRFDLAHQRQQFVVGSFARKTQRFAPPPRSEKVARALADLIAFALAAFAPLLGFEHLLEALHRAGQHQRPRLGLGIARQRVDLRGQRRLCQLLELAAETRELALAQFALSALGQIELQPRAPDGQRPGRLLVRKTDGLPQEHEPLLRVGRGIRAEHAEPRRLRELTHLDVVQGRLLEPPESLLTAGARRFAETKAAEQRGRTGSNAHRPILRPKVANRPHVPGLGLGSQTTNTTAPPKHKLAKLAPRESCLGAEGPPARLARSSERASFHAMASGS